MRVKNIKKRFIWTCFFVGFDFLSPGDGLFAFSGDDLGDIANITIEKGESRINGVEMPIDSYAGFKGADDLFLALKENLKGKYTVTKELTDVSTVIVVADVFSYQCPKCKMPTLKNIAGIIDSAYAISVFDFAGAPPFALGSCTGKLINASKNVPSYDGDIFKNSIKKIQLLGNAEYKFSRTFVNNLYGKAAAGISKMQDIIAGDLEAEGYVPFDFSSNQEVAGKKRPLIQNEKRNFFVYQKGASVIHVELLPGESKNQFNETVVKINEVITR